VSSARLTRPLATGLAVVAWIRQAEGDAAVALDAIADAERVAPFHTAPSLVNPVPAQRARLLLAQGEVAAATRWTEERELRAARRANVSARAGVSHVGPRASCPYPARAGVRVLERVLALLMRQG